MAIASIPFDAVYHLRKARTALLKVMINERKRCSRQMLITELMKKICFVAAYSSRNIMCRNLTPVKTHIKVSE